MEGKALGYRIAKLLVLASLFWLAPGALPGAGASPPPPGTDGEATIATLANGLRVVIVPDPIAPVVTTRVTYLAGAVDSPDAFPGMAHAQEHMMFRGNPGLSGAAFSAVSAALGGDTNAWTSQVATSYHLTVPSDALSAALEIESIRMRGVLDRQKDWEKERGALEQEVSRDLSDPDYLFYIRLLRATYPGTPYDRTALGTKESFDRTTGAMLARFHRDWYGPNNALLVVAGDVEPSAALAEVERLFGPIPRRPVPPRRSFAIPPLSPSRIDMDTDAPVGKAVVAYRLPGYESPDYAAGVVLADVLSSRRWKLFDLVTGGKALSVEFGNDPLPKASIGYAEVAFPKGGDGEGLLAALRSAVAGCVKEGVPAELVEAEKRREIAEAAFRRNSIAGLAMAWTQALAVEGRRSPDDDVEAIRKVTAADVDRVAREWLVDATAVTALLTPRESGGAVASKASRGGESFAPDRTRHVPLPKWARRVAGRPSVPVPKVRPADFTLPNGLRLVVVPDGGSRTVTVVGRLRNEPAVQVPQGKEGVDGVLNALFEYGTRSLDRVAFRKALDDISADVSAGPAFSLRVPAEGFSRGLDLLAEELLHPALPPEAFEVVRRQTAAAVEGGRRSPGHLAALALRGALFPKGDPELREATGETVSSLTLDDVRAWHASAYRPDLAVIVVAGKVTPEGARAEVERAFGEWKAPGGEKASTDLPAVPPNGPSSVAVPNDVRLQVDATLAGTVSATRFDPDYYPLQVGTRILSGGFYSTRLYRRLREETGLVYFVDARLDAGRTRSVFEVSFGCDPDKVSRAQALAVREVESLRKRLVTPAELARAKTLLVRRLALSGASVDALAATYANLAVTGLPLDEMERASRRYLSVSADEVRDAFRRRIRPDAFVRVTEGPPPR